MNDVLIRLRSDAGRLTLAALIQEREAAACEIERLQSENARLREISKDVRTTRLESRTKVVESNAQQTVLLRLRDVCAALALSRSTIYKRIAEGTFPPPIKISQRSVRWRSQDVDAWRESIEA